jgi:hypothetical protein
MNSILVTPVRDLLIEHLRPRVDDLSLNDTEFCRNAVSVMSSWTKDTPFDVSSTFLRRVRPSSYVNITKAMLLAFMERMADGDADDFIFDPSNGNNPYIEIFFIFCAQRWQRMYLENKKNRVFDADVNGLDLQTLYNSFAELLRMCDVQTITIPGGYECIFDGGKVMMMTEEPVVDDAIDCKCVGGILVSSDVGHGMAYAVTDGRVKVFDSNYKASYDLCDFGERYKRYINKLGYACVDYSHANLMRRFPNSLSYYIHTNEQSGGMLKTMVSTSPADTAYGRHALLEPEHHEMYPCLMSIALAAMVEPKQEGGGRAGLAGWVLGGITVAMAVVGSLYS